MTRIKKFLSLGLIVALLLCCLVGFGLKPLIARADNVSEIPEEWETEQTAEGGEAVPYGIFTSLDLALDCGNGEVWATVTNTFTLFPAVVRVVVQLYCSDTYQENHSTMTLVCRNSIDDLNMNQSIETRASTNGEQKYWKARMYYKVDAKDWKENETVCALIDGDGVYVM